MRFSDIPGLDNIKSTLTDLTDRENIPHALLFNGKEGYGHLALTLAFQQYLTCGNRQNGDACGTCPACSQASKLVHPDHHFIFPVSNTKKTTGKEAVSQAFLPEWREWLAGNPYGAPADWASFAGFENKEMNIAREENYAIVRALSVTSFSGKYKTMTIWLPEYMHPSTSNGILKILEEPPERTIFILVTNDSDRLLATITSRTQIISVPAFHPDNVASYLQNKGVEQAKALEVASLSEGSISRALMMLDETDDQTHDIFRRWMVLCFKRDIEGLIQFSEEFQRYSRVMQKSVLVYGLAVFRESIIALHKGEKVHHFPKERVEWVGKFASTLSLAFIEDVQQMLNEAIYHIERNANPKVMMTTLSLSISKKFNS